MKIVKINELGGKYMIKGKKIALWVTCIIGILILFLVAVTVICGNYLLNKVDKVEINKDNVGITEEVEEQLSKYDDKITNIALFGVDTEEGKAGRADSIMIVTLDFHNKKLKLSSIMRDSYVNIDGYGTDKINHAYAFGGAELAIKTLNQNFNLNIEDFIAVNFTTMPKIIDKIGGITMNITSEEVSHIQGIYSDGTYNLTGSQALAYSRIRYATGGDYARSERQRNVLSKVFEKILVMNSTEYPELLSEILPMVKTSFSSSEILELGTEVLSMGTASLEQERFPLDGYCEGKMINGVYYLTFDKEATVNQLHEYIFEDKKVCK